MRLVTLIVLATGFSDLALACSCAPSEPFCNGGGPPQSGGPKSIFVGRVRHADSWTFQVLREVWDALFGKTTDYWNRHVEFEVRERFEGADGATFELVTGWGQCCDCSMDFKEGQDYFVIARQGKDGTWSTSICARTRAAEYATDEIEDRRAKSRGQESPRKVYGYIYQTRGDDFRPVDSVPLVLRSGDEERRVTSNSAGYYRFSGLNAKNYSLSSDRQDVRIWRNEIDLVHNRCANVSASVEMPK